MKTYTVPTLWPSETCYLIGGGPSLPIELLGSLQGKNVIAINNSYILTPWAEFLFFMDFDWALQHQVGLKEFKGTIITISSAAAERFGTKYMLRGPISGLTKNNHILHTGLNSGHCAINLAALLGVNRIILIGFDMHIRNGIHNWHQTHSRVVDAHVYQGHYLKHMEALATPLRQRGIEMLNASPNSALQSYKKVNFLDYL